MSGNGREGLTIVVPVYNERDAVERSDAPAGALDLKMVHDVPAFINVRAAGDRRCWTDNSDEAASLRTVG